MMEVTGLKIKIISNGSLWELEKDIQAWIDSRGKGKELVSISYSESQSVSQHNTNWYSAGVLIVYRDI